MGSFFWGLFSGEGPSPSVVLNKARPTHKSGGLVAQDHDDHVFPPAIFSRSSRGLICAMCSSRRKRWRWTNSKELRAPTQPGSPRRAGRRSGRVLEDRLELVAAGEPEPMGRLRLPFSLGGRRSRRRGRQAKPCPTRQAPSAREARHFEQPAGQARKRRHVYRLELTIGLDFSCRPVITESSVD